MPSACLAKDCQRCTLGQMMRTPSWSGCLALMQPASSVTEVSHHWDHHAWGYAVIQYKALTHRLWICSYSCEYVWTCAITIPLQGQSPRTRVVIVNHKFQTSMHYVLYSSTWLVFVVITEWLSPHSGCQLLWIYEEGSVSYIRCLSFLVVNCIFPLMSSSLPRDIETLINTFFFHDS